MHVPAAARPGPRPLLLDLHGSGFNPAAQLELSGMRRVADGLGFVVAAPGGVLDVPPFPASDSRGSLGWNVPGVPTTGGAHPPAGARDDVAFLLRVVDDVGERTGTDPGRVFLCGFSGGARLACAVAARYSERIAGVATVAGLRAGRADPADLGRPDPREPRPTAPVPVVAFHGRRDEVNPYDGSADPRWGYPVPLAARTWAGWNGCDRAVAELDVAPAVTRARWSGEAEVDLYTVDDGGHTWPGSALPLPGFGGVNAGLDASAVIGALLERHASR